MIKKRLLFSILFLLSLSIQAQSIFNAGGADAVNAEMSLSYSIGQVFYEPFNSYGGTLKASPGVQQTYDIQEVFPPDELKIVNITALNIKLYPNPTIDNLQLSILDDDFTKYNVRLVSLLGNVISSYQIKERTTLVDMQRLAAGVYFLQVEKERKDMKIFKVIKK